MSIVPATAPHTTPVINNVQGDQIVVNEYHYCACQRTRFSPPAPSIDPITEYIVVNNVAGDQYNIHEYYYAPQDSGNRWNRAWGRVVKLWLKTKT
jgi:hypothetical protein